MSRVCSNPVERTPLALQDDLFSDHFVHWNSKFCRRALSHFFVGKFSNDYQMKIVPILKYKLWCNRQFRFLLAARKPTVFVREATGLVKSVSFFDAIALNVSSMATGVALASIGFTMVLLPSISGINLVYASIIGFVFSVPQVIVYTIMTLKVPRTGGDYVWISRSLGGPFGSAISLMGFTLQTLAFLALTVLTTVFAIGSVGVSLGYGGFLGLALPGNVPGAAPWSQFLLGILIFGILIVVNILKPKAGYKIVSVFTVVGILTMILAMGTLLAAGNQGVQNYVTSLNSMGANVTYTGIANSYSGSTFDLMPNLFILPFFAIFVYPWVVAGPAVASEIKGKNTLRWNVPLAAVISVVLLTAGFGVMYYVGGFAFTNAALANVNLVYNYSFNFWTLAMGVTNIPALAWAIGLGWIVWNIAVLAYGIIIFSRVRFRSSIRSVSTSKACLRKPHLRLPSNRTRNRSRLDYSLRRVSSLPLRTPILTLRRRVVRGHLFRVRRTSGRDLRLAE